MACSSPLVNGHTSTNAHKDLEGYTHLNGQVDPSLSTRIDESMVEPGHTGMCHDAEPYQPVEPVAIIGMAMRLPGGVRNAEDFWDMLIHKKSGQCLVPKNRYNIDAWYGPNKAGHVASKYGYFLDDLDLEAMDTSFWTMTKQEVEALDPQQRLLLEVVYETFQSAGAKEWRDKNIGCYVGTFEGDWLEMDGRDPQTMHPYRLTGYGDYMAANRISYEFGLKGPSVTIRTACSSALTGLHDACKALFSGECTSAIVGASNLILSPRTTSTMQDQGVMSPTGSCKSFDANADGYARGEAISALYIKKLSTAILNGDPVRAVIKSTCINSGGKGVSLTTPNAKAQEDLIRRGHALAGISDLSKTAMIQCHGTGTMIGDPIETSAVAGVFGEHGIYIGSVKPNLGHSEGASGLSSIIKMVLALEHNTIPPNINFKIPNPKIPFEGAKLKVPTECLPWPGDRMKRVGVNSFGIGGSNAHVLLESATSYGLGQGTASSGVAESRPRLLIFSAKHPQALRRMAEDHESYLSAHPDSLHDMSYSLATKREVLSHRAFCITTGDDACEISRVAKPDNEEPPKLVFTFTGQGAQWAQMGKDLIEQETSFHQSIRALDGCLSELPEAPQWSLEGEILTTSQRSRLPEAEFSQPCCTAIQIALVDLLSKWGVKPDAVVGHSSGEIGAAYACGSVTAREAIIIAYYRGQVLRSLSKTRTGGMAVVGLGRNDVTAYLNPGVTIGCENSPNSITLSGDQKPLNMILETIRTKQPEVFVRRLRVEVAYHSYHMDELAHKYQALLCNHVLAQRPKVPFFSSVTGDVVKEGAGVLGATYWAQNLISPVLFLPAVNATLRGLPSRKVFLEIGPHSALQAPLRQISKANETPFDYLPTLKRNHNGQEDLLATAGELWLNNFSIDFGAMIGPGRFMNDLPSYPWHYENSYWAESRLSREWRHREFPQHDLLGSRIIESTSFDPSWRNLLSLDNVSWVQEHEILGDILLPGAAYICMTAETIRQLTGSTDFTVRQVVFNAPLILHHGPPVEIITSLHRARLTTSLDSAWYEFSISTLNGSTWVKHCLGQVKAGFDVMKPLSTIVSQRRDVPSQKWYGILREVGLEYGPRFSGLTAISTDPVNKVAVANVRNDIREGETFYAIHPVSLDCALQLFSVAAYHGLQRLFKSAAIPSYIEELYVRPPKGEILMQAHAASQPDGTIFGDLEAISDGETVIVMRGLRLSSIGDNVTISSDPHKAAQLVWKSDLNLLDASQLIRPAKCSTDAHSLLDKLGLACMIETHHRLKNKGVTQPHHEKYWSWLDGQLTLTFEDHYTDCKSYTSLVTMDSKERSATIQTLVEQAKGTEAAAVATAIHRVLTFCGDIFSGVTDALELLQRDGILERLYTFIQQSDLYDFLALAAHRKPTMRVLEIGARAGCNTSIILPHLQSSFGERMYSSYTYTDSSAGFFPAATERFQAYAAMQFVTLDISADPLDQGFERESFDLIIACNALHTTPKLSKTLEHVRSLLHPGGRIFLQELSPVTKWINYVMGTLPHWWVGENDKRVNEPYVSHERWDRELREAGFEGISAIVYDGYLNNNMIAIPSRARKETKRITVVHEERDSNMVDVVRRLCKAGYEIDYCTINQPPIPHQDIVSLLDISKPFLDSVDQAGYDAFRSFVASIQGSGVLWVTGAVQIACQNPRYALIHGIARTIRNELSIDFATLELETFDQQGYDIVCKVLCEFENRIQDPEIKCTMEWAYSGGEIQISRYHWISITQELSEPKRQFAPIKLDMDKPGLPDTLHWRQIEPMLLKGDEVELEVRAVGLNYRDVLLSIGVIDAGHALARGLGFECSGIVRKVGPDVNNYTVGDRVICNSSGCFASVVTASERLCAKIPDDLGFVEAATMPIVYCTVIHGLVDVAKIQSGNTVLVHSACGGVGLAAVQLCQAMGAQVFCTVGHPQKVDYLVQNLRVPRNRIFSSRDNTFFADIMQATSGKGVDIVLNSLSGELLHISWKCVAEFGIMVDIGKRDFQGKAVLAMDPFEANRSYAGVDLSQISVDRPAAMQSLICRAMEYHKRGSIRPITPVKTFEAAYIGDAFRYMQKGNHIGKIVITMPECIDELPFKAGRRKLLLRSNVVYLLVGGLGGLGRLVATWLVEQGAKHIVFFSRSAGSLSEDDPYKSELEALGCFVQMFSGSIACYTDVQKVIASIGKPIGGVLQASMVLDDESFVDMTFSQWQASIVPKVQGTWNLHQVLETQSESLDFFFLFSSICGASGQLGQANYASANTFLDAFVQYRHSLGLPASTIDIGLVEHAGYLSQNRQILESLRATSMHCLHEQDLLDAIQLMIHRSYPPNSTSSASPGSNYTNPSQIGLGFSSTRPLSAPNNRTIWRKDPRMSVYRNMETTQSAFTSANANDNLKQFLRAAMSNPGSLQAPAGIVFLASEIGSTLFSFLMRSGEPLDLDTPLTVLGIDSLVSIELRNWFRQRCGLDFTVLEIVGASSIRHLGETAAVKLTEKFNAKL